LKAEGKQKGQKGQKGLFVIFALLAFFASPSFFEERTVKGIMADCALVDL
jgi:hypothetical protein